jgi:hypothetical protein
MIMKPSLEADKFSNPKSNLNAKKLSYFKVSAGFRDALPSLRTCVRYARNNVSVASRGAHLPASWAVFHLT